MIYGASERGPAFHAAMERHMLKAKDPRKRAHGNHKERRSQKGHRRISRETRKLDLSL